MASQIWPSVITLLTLVVLIWVSFIVGHYRTKYNVKAPATTGDPHFERAFRVQMNTIESAFVFLPALWLAARWGNSSAVLLAGAAWLIGRIVYALTYLKDPAKRSAGFGIAFLAIIVLMADAGLGLLRALGAGSGS
jgi:uncharacterized membrane protein YecN with MAPEG domain